MAVGYEKLNSSAARSRRRSQHRHSHKQSSIVEAGRGVWDATYGKGKTLEDFIADVDMVRCEFAGGIVITMRGSAVRQGVWDAERKIQDV